MPYKKEDFLLLKDTAGSDVLVNIGRITFVVEHKDRGFCDFFFNGGEDDYVGIRTSIEDFLELI